jgi:hypothetical protein
LVGHPCFEDGNIVRRRMSGLERWTISEGDYLGIVDETARRVAARKRSAMSAEALPLVQRLGIKPEAWIATMKEGGSMLGSALGGPEARRCWAASRGQCWTADKSGLWEKVGVLYSSPSPLYSSFIPVSWGCGNKWVSFIPVLVLISGCPLFLLC